VQQVIANAAGAVNRYPDPGSVVLREAIAAHYGVSAAQVGVATGAVALCYQCAHATSGPGDEVIFAWRSFEAYPILTSVVGATAVPIPLRDDATHDLTAMAAAVTPRTRLIFICSPNNPTGTTVAADELTDFLAVVPSDVLVVVDEAYVEFSRDARAAAGLDLIGTHENVVVLRTFSKAYGLAGLRLGYAIGSQQIIEALNKTSLPFGVSSIAQAAGVASIDDASELAARVGQLVGARSLLEAQLRDHDVPVVASQANFVWLPLGDATTEFAQTCEAAGLTVRAFAGEGVRVTVAEPEANSRLVAVAADFVSAHGLGSAQSVME
jgi:histidinol-phosphate aminotransferase